MWTWLGINDDPKTSAQVKNDKPSAPVKNDDQINNEQVQNDNQNISAPGNTLDVKENIETDDSLIVVEDPKKEGIDKNDANEQDVNQEVNQKDKLKKDIADVASNLGNYLYSFAGKATKTASKLKETVDHKLEKSIVGDFQRENEKFVQEKEARRIGDAVPPWVGYHEESTMKRQIIALSSDERNFLRNPPSGVEFQFSMEHCMPVAIAALKEDEELKNMRFKLVPKRVSEERFWRNYFYRVSLIKQSTQLSSLAEQELRQSPRLSSSSESLNKDIKSEPTEIHDRNTPSEDLAESPTANEFVSDAFQENQGLSEEERKQMLGEGKTNPTNNVTGSLSDDWEKEIQEELESFELVSGDKKEEFDQWEQEIEDMLELDEDQKKQ